MLDISSQISLVVHFYLQMLLRVVHGYLIILTSEKWFFILSSNQMYDKLPWVAR